jgi:hypothetical protein
MPVHATSGILLGQESGMNEKRAQLLPGGKPFSGPLETLEFTNASVSLPQSWLSFGTRNAKDIPDMMLSLRAEGT